MRAISTYYAPSAQPFLVALSAFVSASMLFRTMTRTDRSDQLEETDGESQSTASLLTMIRSQYIWFREDFTRAPKIASGPHRSLGIDNQQRSQYDLSEIRASVSTHSSIVQVVGDSGTPFDGGRIPAALAILSCYIGNDTAIEYGFTASKNDTNWLVNEYQRTNPQVELIANLVEQAVEALEAGMEGSSNVSIFVTLFDRLSPTRFGDDIWLSDGIMSRDRGDKMLCFEGGPQALYQCSNALLKGMQVVAVTNLRSARFSAARFLMASRIGFERAEEYLEEVKATPKQSSVARWCLSSWRESGRDLALLIEVVDTNKRCVSA